MAQIHHRNRGIHRYRIKQTAVDQFEIERSVELQEIILGVYLRWAPMAYDIQTLDEAETLIRQFEAEDRESLAYPRIVKRPHLLDADRTPPPPPSDDDEPLPKMDLRAAGEAVDDLLARIFSQESTDGPIKVHGLTISISYAVVAVGLKRLESDIGSRFYYERAERFWAFVHANMKVEMSLHALRTAQELKLPLDTADQPSLRAMMDHLSGILLR